MGKIKQFFESEKGKDILVIFIIILVGIVSFELGRLSKENGPRGLKIDYRGQEAGILASNTPISGLNSENISQNTLAPSTQNKGDYFASKRGKKFYGITCSAGKTIKEENKIYFSTADAAINAGYELSSACK